MLFSSFVQSLASALYQLLNPTDKYPRIIVTRMTTKLPLINQTFCLYMEEIVLVVIVIVVIVVFAAAATVVI